MHLGLYPSLSLPTDSAEEPCELSSRQGTGRAANDGRRCCTTKLSRNAFREFPGTEFGKHASGKTTSKAVASGSGEGAADQAMSQHPFDGDARTQVAD